MIWDDCVVPAVTSPHGPVARPAENIDTCITHVTPATRAQTGGTVCVYARCFRHSSVAHLVSSLSVNWLMRVWISCFASVRLPSKSACQKSAAECPVCSCLPAMQAGYGSSHAGVTPFTESMARGLKSARRVSMCLQTISYALRIPLTVPASYRLLTSPAFL